MDAATCPTVAPAAFTGTATVTMNTNLTRTAVFITPATYTITVAKSGPGTGTVTPDVGPHGYAEGAPIALAAAPDLGSYFGGWLFDFGGGNQANAYTYAVSSTMPASNFTATADFETAGFNVLVFSNQYNGFFYDEKTAGIELIHHGVRTATGGAHPNRPRLRQSSVRP